MEKIYLKRVKKVGKPFTLYFVYGYSDKEQTRLLAIWDFDTGSLPNKRRKIIRVNYTFYTPQWI